MRSLWPDSLFARMLLVQGILVASAAMIFSVVLNVDRLSLMARPYAALGVPALRQVAAGPIGAPLVPMRPLSEGIRREAGLPTGLRVPAFMQPSRQFKAELAEHGIQMEGMWLTDLARGSVWVALRFEGGDPLCISLNGLPLLPHWSAAAAVGLSLLLLVVATVSRYFVLRVTQPLARLHARMLGHASAGVAPPAPLPPRSSDDPPELQAMDQAYTQLTEKLERNERERALLLAGVSHDLRSPLARIRLAAEMLPESAENAEEVATVTRNVDLADRLIASFLEFVRSGTQKMDETVDAAAVVREALARINRQDVAVSAQIPEHLVLQGASSLLLERLVVNLVENAMKHAGSAVQVRLACVGQTMELTVVDGGRGLPPGSAERMMEAFARGDPSRGVPGFGLGLAIVQQIVTRWGGRLSFEQGPVGHQVLVVVPLSR